MSKHFKPNEQEAWVGWVRASQLVMEAIEQELKEAGFPPLAWYDALLELDGAPEGKLRLSELGEKMLLKKFNVTRLVDRMEKEGYVTRVACDTDARGAYAAITPKGKKRRVAMWSSYRDAVHKHFLAHLSEKEMSQLSSMLRKIQLKLT